MELYVGGRCQGKLEYVLANQGGIHGKEAKPVITDGETCPLDEPLGADILNHFHLLIKRLIACDRDVFAYMEKLLAQNPHITIICDEVGMGIVPADAWERQYREAVGRCCCMAAKRAKRVERIVCGRGLRIQ